MRTIFDRLAVLLKLRHNLSLAAVGLVATGLLSWWGAISGPDAIHTHFSPASWLRHQALAGPSSTRDVDLKKEGVSIRHQETPLTFIPNRGQVHAAVRYYAQEPGCGIYFTAKEAVLVFAKLPSAAKTGMRPTAFGAGTPGEVRFTTPSVILRLQPLDVNSKVRLEGHRPGSGKINALIGSDPAKWRTGLPAYYGVTYHDLWPGIDLRFHGGGGQLKYEFVLHPGARVEDIRFVYRGAEGLSLDEAGNMEIKTALGVITDERPVSFQQINDRRLPVQSRFVLARRVSGATEIRYAVGGDYDPQYPLIIDPGLAYSSFLGGSGSDSGVIDVDAQGNAYVAGQTNSADFPASSTLFPNRGYDAFVAKLDATGALVYATYIGGSGDEGANNIAVDASGNAYIAGSTNSADFPTVSAYQATKRAEYNAFVTKLSPSGSALVYSTYLGGTWADFATHCAVDDLGNAYVAGLTISPDFPTKRPFQPTNRGWDAFVAKLNASGSDLVFSTFLGGSGYDHAHEIAVDSQGNACVTGRTDSRDFPTKNASQGTYGGDQWDVFLAKFDGSSGEALFSTYVGGSRNEYPEGVTTDEDDNVYLTGWTVSADFRTLNGLQSSHRGLTDGYLIKFDPAGIVLYSTFLGGSGGDTIAGVAVDSSGYIYVAGLTWSGDFPTTASGHDRSVSGYYYDAFVTKINPAGSAIVYSTYLGGSYEDLALDIGVSASGSAWVTGRTQSPDFPATAPALDRSYGGNTDAFLVRLDLFPDVSPPTWPAGSSLTAADVDLTSLRLNWAAATDDWGVEAYRLYLDGALLATLPPYYRSYSVAGLTAGAEHSFKVEAGDAYGNWSATGPSVTVRTLTPQTATQKLIDEVYRLVSSGILTHGQGSALKATLGMATQQIEQGNVTAAIEQLQAFINQVNAFVQSGSLSSYYAQPLIAAAQRIISTLRS